MSATELQTLLRFLSQDAKVPLATAIGKVKELQRVDLDSPEKIAKTKFDDAIVTRIYEGKLQLRDTLKQPVEDLSSFKQSVVNIFEDCHEEFDHPSISAGKDEVTLMDVAKEFCRFWAEKEKEASLLFDKGQLIIYMQ